MKIFTDIYGIFFDCPAGVRCEECPINKNDYHSFKEKISWFEKLTSEEKGNILKHHKECSNNRGKKESAKDELYFKNLNSICK